jgi:peptide/nickel transport system permease protein
VLLVGPSGTAEQVAEVRRDLRLDEPIPTQLLTYMGKLASGDLGTSFITNDSVAKVIGQRIGTSVRLAGSALVLVLLVSAPIGLIAGALTREGRHRRGEVGFTAITSLVGAMPEYLTATLLAFVFAVWLRILPVAGGTSWEALILPVLAVSLRPIAVLARIVRVETLGVLAQDYMRTARSKRLPARLIYFRHALPNVISSALAIGGILFASLIGGAVVVENVFALPGLGTALIDAVVARDYPVIQGVILVLGVTVVVVNAIVDVLLGIVDPRSLSAQV